MKKEDFKYLSNSEIKVKLIELENEYKATQNKIRDCVQKLNILDECYTEGKAILNKRTNGLNI